MNDWIVVAITLFFSAMFSGLEIAFNSTNRLQLEVDIKKNKFSAKIVSLFFKHSRISSHRCSSATILPTLSMVLQ